MSPLTISVIVPTYNRPALALECIESVLGNEYSEYEILVIDQGPDGTLRDALSSRYGHAGAVRHFFMERPGLNRARNLGVQNARGEVTAFIDDDAVAAAQWLGGIAETFTEVHPRPALMGGRTLPIWTRPKPRWYPPEREFLLGLYDIGEEARPFPEHDLPVGANMAGVRQKIIDIGTFHEALEADHSRPRSFVTGGDSMLAQQLKDAGCLIYYQPKATVHHRIAGAKLTPRYFLRRHYWEGVTVVTRMKLMGQITRADRPALVSHHLGAIGRSGLTFLAALGSTRSQTPRSVATMRVLAHIAYGVGMIRALRSCGS